MTRFLGRFQRWPTAIGAVLLLQMSFGVWMARVAGSDPHFAIAPDYYRRAVRWDSTMAQSRRDRALGWRASATITRDTGRTALLHLSLTDAGDTFVAADSIDVEVLAVAHAGRVHRLPLQRIGDAYQARIPVAAAGLWDVSLRARRDTSLFTARLRVELQ
ncbi:MAG TPA: FixH family protein [Gemmatimonadaceae bacterium]|nr:FixH family protein [Gemmatimonadaceae bacterium]